MSSPRVPNESDTRERPPGNWIKWGTCGWAEDKTALDVVELGDGTAAATGRPLVHVTLFEGRDITQRPAAGQAQGRRIKCQLGWPLTVVPPLGMQVVVLFPDGDMATAGNGVLTCGVSPPGTQLNATRGMLDTGVGIDLIVKAKSVTVTDHGADESPARFACFVTVGPPPAGGDPGVVLQDPTGSGLVIANGVVGAVATDNASPPAAKAVLNISATQILLALNGKGSIHCDAGTGDMTIVATGKGYYTAASCYFGATPTRATPALVGLTGLEGLPSTSVFISS